MPIGKCALCLRQKELVKSHLIPRAMYDYCRTADSEPVVMTSKVMMQSSRQMQDYLLCFDCEGLLNREGENWLTPLLATIDKKFPLLDLLERLPPEVVDAEEQGVGYAAFRNPEVRTEKLIHFAMGVFWKASVHPWRGDSEEPLIELGPYRESIRTFLLGERPFPSHMGLVVGLLPRENALISFNQPYRTLAEGHHRYLLYIPGIQFVLHVGNRLPSDMPSICIATNPARPIVVADFSKDVAKVFREIAAKARKSAKLIEYLKRTKS